MHLLVILLRILNTVIKVLRNNSIFFNFFIIASSLAFSNNIKSSLTDVDNIKNIFSPQSIIEFFVYPSVLRDYALSGISIVEFNVGDDGKIYEIEIIKSLGQPFDDAIFDGLSTFSSQEIIQSNISKGFRYRLPIYFKN